MAKNEEDLPKSNALSKAIRAPGLNFLFKVKNTIFKINNSALSGRLDNSLWEIRAASSEIQLKGLPPRTPQPSPMISRKNSDRQLHKRLLSQEKPYSRSLTASPNVDFINNNAKPELPLPITMPSNSDSKKLERPLSANVQPEEKIELQKANPANQDAADGKDLNVSGQQETETQIKRSEEESNTLPKGTR